MDRKDIDQGVDTRLSDFKMNNNSLRIVAFACCLIIIFTFGTQAFFGGTITTLTVNSGHYYLFDHDKYNEISLSVLLALAAQSGIALLAFCIGVICTICLVTRMKRGSH
jgi:uncharacterized membrane protein